MKDPSSKRARNTSAKSKTRTKLVKSRRRTKAGKKAEPTKPKRQFDEFDILRITDDFLQDTRALALTLDNIRESLESSMTLHANNLQKFIDPYESKANKDSISISIPVSKLPKLRRILIGLKISANSGLLTRRGLFLVLVSKWDAYVGNILRWMYDAQPEILNSSDRSIKYTDLKQIGSMKAARTKIVEEEVAAVIRESHVDQFDYVEKKLGIKLRENLAIWPQFVELMQRRHLIAHTDGKVSSQYLSICKQHGVHLKRDIKLGKEANVSENYFLDSCDCLTEMGFKLSQVLWRKLKPDDTKNAEKHLIDTTYDMIEAGQYKPAISILSFSLEKPIKFVSSERRYMCVLNLAQAYKWSGDNDQCLRIMEKEDWSALDGRFRLAVAVLRDAYDEAAAWMKSIGSKGSVRKEDYDNWPLFRDFRQTPEFLKAYREVFKTEKSAPKDVSSYLEDVSDRPTDHDKAGALDQEDADTRPKSEP